MLYYMQNHTVSSLNPVEFGRKSITDLLAQRQAGYGLPPDLTYEYHHKCSRASSALPRWRRGDLRGADTPPGRFPKVGVLQLHRLWRKPESWRGSRACQSASPRAGREAGKARVHYGNVVNSVRYGEHREALHLSRDVYLG